MNGWTVRTQLHDEFLVAFNDLRRVYSMLSNNGQLLQEFFVNMRKKGYPVGSPADALSHLEIEINDFGTIAGMIKEATTILFPKPQVEVLLAGRDDYTDKLSFQLPYNNTFVLFDEPVAVWEGADPDDFVLGLVLHQHIVTTEEIRNSKKALQEARGPGAEWMKAMRMVDIQPGNVLNSCGVIHADHEVKKLTWSSESSGSFFEKVNSDRILNHWVQFKNLALACVGFINCENVHLHGHYVSEKINRKRVKNKKKPLEPYYTCRIRGVSYEGTTRSHSGGVHSYMYDVRGHFRKLASGKTTWVRPHLRGVENAVYVPKEYKLDRPS